jgi:tRNA threonylcarbamoyladenosine biosynthesis protein TsaB
MTADAQRSRPEIVVRRFRPTDAAALEAIAQKSPEAAQWSRTQYETLESTGRSTWVIESGGQVRAFLIARAVAGQAEILNLAVDPDRRRTGCAQALLQEATAEFRRAQIESIFLEVRESNTPALRFYAKHGFVETGRRHGYYRQPDEDAVLMIRKLTG